MHRSMDFSLPLILFTKLINMHIAPPTTHCGIPIGQFTVICSSSPPPVIERCGVVKLTKTPITISKTRSIITLACKLYATSSNCDDGTPNMGGGGESNESKFEITYIR